MPISLRHSFVSPKANGPDSTLVQPSNWNQEHVLTMATARLLGRTAAGDGPAQEISVGPNLSYASGSLNLASSVSITTLEVTGTTTLGSSVLISNTGFTGIRKAETASGLWVSGGTDLTDGASLSVYGSTHPTVANEAIIEADTLTIRSVGNTPRAVLSNTGLQVTGSIDASTQFLGQAGDTATAPSFSFTGDTNLGMFRPATDTLGITTAGTERLRVTSTGNVSIGTALQPGLLNVDGVAFIGPNAVTSSADFNTTGDVRVYTGASTATGAVSLESLAAVTTARHHISFSNPNGVVGSISTSASATAYNTASDYRLKRDVEPLTGAAARILALNPVRFRWNAAPDGQPVDGFLAHEAQGVVPEAVTGTKDEHDEHGAPVYQSIDQSKLVPLLTAALRDALTRIDRLEERLSSLEAT